MARGLKKLSSDSFVVAIERRSSRSLHYMGAGEIRFRDLAASRTVVSA